MVGGAEGFCCRLLLLMNYTMGMNLKINKKETKPKNSIQVPGCELWKK